jgi:hypothetical protein
MLLFLRHKPFDFCHFEILVTGVFIPWEPNLTLDIKPPLHIKAGSSRT